MECEEVSLGTVPVPRSSDLQRRETQEWKHVPIIGHGHNHRDKPQYKIVSQRSVVGGRIVSCVEEVRLEVAGGDVGGGEKLGKY